MPMSLDADSTNTESTDHSEVLPALATREPITVVPTPATSDKDCVISLKGDSTEPLY